MYRLLTQQASVWLFQRKQEKSFKTMIIGYFRLRMLGRLRRAGVLCVYGAFLAWVVVGEVFGHGHGQNIWQLLRHQPQLGRVLPIIWHPVDDEAEATLGGLAAFAEQPKLEALHIICGDIYNVRQFTITQVSDWRKYFWRYSYRFLWARSAEVPSRQRKAICFSSDCWWSG